MSLDITITYTLASLSSKRSLRALSKYSYLVEILKWRCFYDIYSVMVNKYSFTRLEEFPLISELVPFQ